MDNLQNGDGAPSQFIVRPNTEENDQSKLLGIIWNSNSEDFIFSFTQLIDMFGKLQANRRSLLRNNKRFITHLNHMKESLTAYNVWAYEYVYLHTYLKSTIHAKCLY